MNYCFLSFWQIKKENFPKKRVTKGYVRAVLITSLQKVKEIRFRNMKFFLYIIALANEPKF